MVNFLVNFIHLLLQHKHENLVLGLGEPASRRSQIREMRRAAERESISNSQMPAGQKQRWRERVVLSPIYGPDEASKIVEGVERVVSSLGDGVLPGLSLRVAAASVGGRAWRGQRRTTTRYEALFTFCSVSYEIARTEPGSMICMCCRLTPYSVQLLHRQPLPRNNTSQPYRGLVAAAEPLVTGPIFAHKPC